MSAIAALFRANLKDGWLSQSSGKSTQDGGHEGEKVSAGRHANHHGVSKQQRHPHSLIFSERPTPRPIAPSLVLTQGNFPIPQTQGNFPTPTPQSPQHYKTHSNNQQNSMAVPRDIAGGLMESFSNHLSISTSPTSTFYSPAGSLGHFRRQQGGQPSKVLKPFATEDIKILLLENVNETARDILTKQGYQVEFHKSSLPEDQLIEKIR